MKRMKVTFIGLGIMGSRMAENLLKFKVDLTVFNRSAAPVKKLEEKGAKAATSYQEAVKNADIVFTMLARPEAVEEVMLEENGGLSNMKKNALWVDCSTVNPSFTEKAAAIAHKKNIRFLDAPVAGTKPTAANAELVFFVGGAEKDLKEAESLLNFMGKKIMHIGETGKGSAFKMLVNAQLAQSMLIFAETLLLGEKMGIQKNFLLDTLPNLAVSAPFTKMKAELIRENDYEAQFPLELMHKDLHLAALTAYENDQPLYLANLAKELFGDAKNAGLGRYDFSAIYHFLEGKSKK
ncbi:NAD(P)-dependent oxidoreductase [Limibacter armeniacum]|uniref:NAD(P)-dependent oxidoreductase n=1 Tax=Limibacter armeniacum TaxID=466084 RepID=UPI002FE51C1B